MHRPALSGLEPKQAPPVLFLGLIQPPILTTALDITGNPQRIVMKTLIAILILLAAPFAHAFDVASITFQIASSATTSVPNLRIGVMKGKLGTDGDVKIQAMPIPRPVNYHLTKSTTHTFTTGTTAIEIQVDQDTKMYTGSDLSNYLLIYSGIPVTYSVR